MPDLGFGTRIEWYRKVMFVKQYRAGSKKMKIFSLFETDQENPVTLGISPVQRVRFVIISPERSTGMTPDGFSS